MFKTMRALVSAAIIFSSFSAMAMIGGDWVGNGGGIAEKNVLYAYERLDQYIEICLTSDTCKLDPRQREIIAKIAKGLPQELRGRMIYFGSEQKTPGFFMIDGLVRVAKTGSSPSSPIYINADLLYSKGADNQYTAVTIPEAVAILVHEFGHHYGGYSHEELDLLGVRISMLLQSKMAVTPLLPWSNDISAMVLTKNVYTAYPDVLLNVGDDVIDISKSIADEAMCYRFSVPIPVLPIPDLDLISKKPAGSVLYNLHWDKFNDSDTRIKVKLIGNISNSCLFKTNILLRSNEYKMSISFSATKINNTWKYDHDSLKVEQYRDPWYKVIRLPFQPMSWGEN
ncbi:hypothetical protein B9G69_016120 [Bdellovibrio sp. SKB1291214]|uniref:hypothetical protein n=1 Tax=Bdellovibrio sp. SKB1291214 TaxID=1732569 RepID=UPI000B516395|nr:hypothetical protein [Bdellovibrio sp. SKB1291214]UYL08571.1 hypothetical protein B9G69_016120 [Bdellovibrio sp. SKB1291214]